MEGDFAIISTHVGILAYTLNMRKNILILLLVAMVVMTGCTTKNTKTEDVTVDFSTKEDVIKALESDNSIVVDTRESYGFNGWVLDGEARGGHIKGAKLFEASWLEILKQDEKVTKELERFEITKDKKIITYGYGEDAKTVATKLLELGYKDVTVYEGGIKEWASDNTLPMEKMENYQYLVSPKWVNDLINGKEVSKYDGREYKIFEASWGNGDEYAKGHIPNAYHINTDEYEEGPLWNRVSDEKILEATLSNGITKDTLVIVYASDITSAARISIILKYLGVEDVRLLDGGYQAWKASGYEIEKGMIEKVSVEDFGVENTPVNPEYIIDMEEAKEVLTDENGRLISIRSWIEYIGETSGYDYIEAAGRIDGAVYGFGGSDPWHMEDFRNPDNTMVNYEYMTQRWANNNINPENINSFYCGTGWRASETWFYAHAMGWKNISLYDGGWKEWSETEGNPTATGEPSEN